jgi:hypothetical protein
MLVMHFVVSFVIDFLKQTSVVGMEMEIATGLIIVMLNENCDDDINVVDATQNDKNNRHDDSKYNDD